MLCPDMTQRTLFAAASYSSSEACCFTRACKEASMVCTVLADSMPPGLARQKDAICEGNRQRMRSQRHGGTCPAVFAVDIPAPPSPSPCRLLLHRWSPRIRGGNVGAHSLAGHPHTQLLSAADAQHDCDCAQPSLNQPLKQSPPAVRAGRHLRRSCSAWQLLRHQWTSSKPASPPLRPADKLATDRTQVPLWH